MTMQLLFPEKKTSRSERIIEAKIRNHIHNEKVKKVKEELPEFLSVKELASYLRLNIKTVYQAINKGEIPAKKIGRTIRVHRDTIIAWFSSCLGGHHGEKHGGQV